jgi:Uma2 family endonuclease
MEISIVKTFSYMPEIPILTEATFERLLNRGHYGIIDNQLLFFSHERGKFVLTQITNEQEYTAADYALLPESAPFQLLNGKLIFMASPKSLHQEIATKLNMIIANYVYSNKLGKFYAAPMDVHFNEKNIVQPDLLFVSISRKAIIEDYIQGAPDFVVEILSDSTAKKDYEDKMKLYGQYDVVEYWIVKPKEQSVEVYHNQAQTMHLHTEAGMADTIKSLAIQGFELEVARIFE